MYGKLLVRKIIAGGRERSNFTTNPKCIPECEAMAFEYLVSIFVREARFLAKYLVSHKQQK
jgi:hypothetical protein